LVFAWFLLYFVLQILEVLQLLLGVDQLGIHLHALVVLHVPVHLFHEFGSIRTSENSVVLHRPIVRMEVVCVRFVKFVVDLLDICIVRNT